ncbi:universal stress protein [Thiohalorhabdus denitrificans]|uniref:Nucleotide-binding universal stress protein, UspA family n=1 Tax=Thiohalorhabdus denitrificans TaxID=381306 RepID=A0A1G5AV00_9GAMM|nr:universal stress protein [Thiohalorhabdus denitrificans]SCX81732.1 Nucleotide-binding universal stress protein, UspA family [Thiohalorhabdus denitrificans]
MHLRRILAPVDQSEPSHHAARSAAEMAIRFQAELHLLHVVTPQLIYAEWPELVMPPEDLTEEMLEQCRRYLEGLEKELTEMGATVTVHCEESAMRPFAAISRFAGDLPADLIVIGSHGRSGLRHALLGSTAERVVRKAPTPVLVVKSAESAPELPESAPEG